MSTIVTPGAGILYMKVGTHARETLDDIIRRKTREIEEAGVAFWGYGGNTCHPENMVNPSPRITKSVDRLSFCVCTRWIRSILHIRCGLMNSR